MRLTLKTAAIFTAAVCAALFLFPNVLSAYPGFVQVTDVIPDAALNIKYYDGDNFVGERIDSYKAPVAILTIEAASALKHAARSLATQGYGLKIFDGYRPKTAVAHFVRWGGDLGDVKTKRDFYPDVAKSDLFRKGYIASRSGHSRGSAVDLTVVHLASGEELDMGSPFDFFGEISHPGSSLVTREQSANRNILSEAMIRAGFKPVNTEWWHFSLAKEPYPDKYFDFPVDHPTTADERTAAYLNAAADGADKVITAVPGKTGAVVRAYLKIQDTWSLRFETAGFFGRSGIKGDKREGDGATPKGVYTFGRAFGVADDPGSTLPYTKVTDNDVWVDDPASSHYNRWAEGNSPSRDWKSAERLANYGTAYKYALSINYNTAPVAPGAGSAIFLHCSTGHPTAGCVSVPESAMIFFLVFIDEYTKIAIGDY
ncbi:MAG: hypothetical protein FWE55_05685 [Synergistaceae bacterium]|nr:hypothetical protein [Synergistaceae bacterium]